MFDRAHHHAGTDRVIRPAHGTFESVAQCADGGEVRLIRWRGITRRAMQQRQILTALCARVLHGVADFIHRCHAGGEHERLAGLDAGLVQVMPEQLVGGDFEKVHVRLEFRDGFEVKRRAGKFYFPFLAMRCERGEHLDGQLPFLAAAQPGALGENFG